MNLNKCSDEVNSNSVFQVSIESITFVEGDEPFWVSKVTVDGEPIPLNFNKFIESCVKIKLDHIGAVMGDLLIAGINLMGDRVFSSFIVKDGETEYWEGC